MAQIYKIYMNEAALVLADFLPETPNEIQPIDHQDFDFEKLFRQVGRQPEPVTYFVQVKKPKEFLNDIKKKVKVIKAAGGLVKNGNGDYLFIHRLNKWDLPKGKVDAGESMRRAAIREVEEECGIRVHYLGRKIQTTYHAYLLKGEVVLKKTNWYEMGVNKVPKLKPQYEEDISEAIWLDRNNLGRVRQNTYPLIAELLDTALTTG